MFKKMIALFISAAIAASYTITAFAAEASTPPPTVAEAYVVMDAETGQVLIEKNMNTKEYPASITKILTVALGLEKGKLEDSVNVTQDAVFAIEPNSSHIALQPDEIVTMKDLVYATMLPSANDAANVIAEHIGGTMKDFADMMNQKAEELGAKNTHFVNANGLPDDDHYTTAYDMALITKYAISVPGFMDVFGMKDTYTIYPTNKQPKERKFATEHMMLVESKFYYEGTLGGKLGWTQEAKHTSVTLAEKNGMKLIVVVLKSDKYDKFKDSIALLDYSFDNFKRMSITKDKLKTFNISHYRSGGSAENVNIYGEKEYSFLVHKNMSDADVSIDYDVPEYYSDEKIHPAVVFETSSISMYEKIGSYPMDYQILALDAEADSTNADVPKKPTITSQLIGILKVIGIVVLSVLGLVVLLFLVMLIIRGYNQFCKWHRRQKRIKRIQQYDDPDIITRPLPPATRRKK
ncbi:D-alanyl-D-alanine carboxypeptidase (penicillin-binding protein 5/6) [Hydrogenoanaerobacterium saccharovorans]|uniref:D-alanyl-D-alanine carboxypeptidase (Penicillin-binding protein 5/6) n=1 Tax=Hydrogenoanaerobacterium saccharovorans TaxID=474960 RepID=A0A1H8A4Q9_9FIRM|nr:D-alanyl-D-alanine carboxypeptidase family protein [Hydrogenoanaerobacterium saccharovorans]RPF48169.1 D-alanyl-D-alanine carboxypeptidase (penicillin-binding protein 5/6) [Hydrogenoanaerobacterium saccharovorans]SEM65571.1 D-alanyl-D-alanine carboxypeptidase (penicillin-binding protein 5/6) [Hydrogenoanaerobacterium saccharovorans]